VIGTYARAISSTQRITRGFGFVSHSVGLRGDTLTVRGRRSARGRSIPVELDAKVRRLDGELTIEAATTAPHRELGMTWSPLGMIPPRSELFVRGYLTPVTRSGVAGWCRGESSIPTSRARCRRA
jgi:hypothetical protein